MPLTGRDAPFWVQAEPVARQMHANFLAEYPSLSATDVPLLRLDLTARRPFEPG